MTQEQLSTIMDTSTQSNMITDITTATSTEYDTATVTVTTTLEAITITAPPTLASIIADCIIMVTVPYPTP
jgi:hypothetical protein